jgi:hypothetical protein
MTRGETAAGTHIVDLTAEEYDAYLDRESRRLAGMGAADFVRAYEAGTLDESDPAVSEVVGLLRIGQNGHPVAAWRSPEVRRPHQHRPESDGD